MKIVFMGTPDFARDSLSAIYDAGHEITAVVTVPDKPKGRGMKLIPCEVKEYAIEKNIKVYLLNKINSSNNEIMLVYNNSNKIENIKIVEISEGLNLLNDFSFFK